MDKNFADSKLWRKLALSIKQHTMFEPYIAKTNETSPGTTYLKVTSCANCPFHQTIEETHEFCSHPDVEPDEFGMVLPGKTFDYAMRNEGYERIPTWCPMRNLKATIINIPDNA